MRQFFKAGCVLAILAVAPAAFADNAPLRFKQRQFHPERASSLSAAQAQREGVVLLQFAKLPTPEQLLAAGVKPLSYVPDQAVLVRMLDGADPATLPGLLWTGSLPAQDKLASSARAALARGAATLLVEAVSDIGHPEIEGLVASAGGLGETRQVMPVYMRLVTGDAAVFEQLAEDPRITWIAPASEPLLRDEPLYFCPGALTVHGMVANFATVQPGWDGGGLGPANLTYIFLNGTGDIAADDEQTAVEAAMGEWANNADLSFTETVTSGLMDQIEILWGAGNHGDPFPFDNGGAPGQGNTLAHAFFPSPPNAETIAGDLHFDEFETWSLVGDIHLFTVALHEIGHSLGLQHSNVGGAVMQAFYGGPVAGLHPDDIAGLRSLYSGPSFPADPCAAAPVAVCTALSKSGLKISAKPGDPDKKKFAFKAQGGSTPPIFFGVPVAYTAHSTCIYDASGNLILELKVDSAAGFWKQKLTDDKSRNSYRKRDGNADGVTAVQQFSGPKTKVQVKGKGSALDFVDLAAFTPTGLTVQQVTTENACVETFFPAGSIEVDVAKGKLKAKVKP